MNHLESMEALRESVRIRAYGQHDPLIEYRRESHILYKQMLEGFEKWLAENQLKIEEMSKQQMTQLKPKVQVQNQPSFAKATAGKIGRNDNCPCGSGKKYKKCHGA